MHAEAMRVELLLIRHALPLRVENRDGSPADPPLSDSGRRQAERLAAWLARERIDALYASPLRRAVETAEPLARARSLEIRIEPRIIEMDWRSDSYVPLDELKRSDYARWRELMAGGLTAGVDLDAFRRSVVDGLEDVIAANGGGRVAVVCHGGVINAWAAHVLEIERPLFFDPVYTSISRFLAAGSGERSVASLNEASHLQAE